MNNLSKRKLIIIWSIVGALVIFYVSGYFFMNGGITNLRYVNHQINYNDGWRMTLNGVTTENVQLPVDVTTKKDEAVVFSKVLPENIRDDDAIIMRNYHQILKVTIDDDLIFSYPNEDWNGMANVISDEWCLVPLNSQYEGKTISISLTNTTIFKFTAYVGDFYYGSDNSLVQYVRGMGFPGVVMGIIVCIIAGMLLIISYLYRNHTNQSQNTAMGAALMGFGIWLTNRAKMVLFPVHSIYVYWGSLMCLMLVAPFVFLYSYYRNAAFKRTALIGFYLCIAADIFMVFSSIFIKYDVEIICMFAYGLSIIALSLNAYSLFLGGFGKASLKKSSIERRLDRTEFVANLTFPVFGTLELVFYNHLLWSEASLYLRSGILFFAISYMVFVLWRTFLVVQDRTIVTKQLHESQLELMMGQIQPHFIFNTLSSIRTLVMVDPKVSYDMLYDFSNYLRANIDNVTNLDGISFASEVEHIKSYVNIEKVRFGDRLNVEYDISEENFMVPPLSIQPLVENAIKHGVCKKMEGGIVLLKSYSDGKNNVVEVCDNGVGFNNETASKVFASAIYDDSIDVETNRVAAEVMHDVMHSLDLRAKDGSPVVISEPTHKEDLSGNGSELHQSTGMLNILLRLRELSDAKVEIHSKEGEGTRIVVLFPKKSI